MKDQKSLILEFRQIPGVGKSIAQDLIDLGFTSVPELKGKNPPSLYENLCAARNLALDRCMLYVFRTAVYFAEDKQHDPELLKWWNWKDKNLKNISAEDLAVIHVR